MRVVSFGGPPQQRLVQQGSNRNRIPLGRAHSTVKEQETHLNNPLEILRSDCRFIEAYTGVDLISTLAPVRDVHDKVIPH
jgi:hypothetical protein